MNYRNFLLVSKLKINFIHRQFSSVCEQNVIKCVPKPPAPMSVAVIGANSPVGRMSALLFKGKRIFKQMYLYDKESTDDVACDLITINSSPTIKNYHGIKKYEAAISRARIVYICGGNQITPGLSEQDLFDRNGPWVRQAITYCAEFNPGTHVVITTPPIAFLVPMAVEEFRKNDINAEKRVYGCIRPLVSRSNSLAGKFMNVIPKSINSFIVGGCHRRTFIPILSELGSNLKEENNEILTDLIQDAEDAVLRVKMKETDSSGCSLSIAYNGVKFTTLLAKALEGEKNIMDCAFVKQEKPMDEYTKYLSCVVDLDTNGIKSCHIPKMSKYEKIRLKKVMNEVRHNIYLGSSYITGDDMFIIRVPPKKKDEKEETKKPEVKAKDEKKEAKKEKCPPKPKPPKSIQIKVTHCPCQE